MNLLRVAGPTGTWGRVLMAGGGRKLNARSPLYVPVLFSTFKPDVRFSTGSGVDASQAASACNGLLHGLDELFQAERLRKEVEVLAIGKVLLESVLSVARNKDDL